MKERTLLKTEKEILKEQVITLTALPQQLVETLREKEGRDYNSFIKILL